MGLLKNLGKAFIETVPGEEPGFDDSNNEVVEVELPAASVEMDNMDLESLINDIYVQNGFSDMSQSIFKVEELINSLPKEMMTEVKRTSVMAILNSFGLTSTEVTLDGESRSTVLDGVLQTITMESEAAIAARENSIEQHKAAISALEREIADKRNDMKKSYDSISIEKDRIMKLLNFISGGNK